MNAFSRFNNPQEIDVNRNGLQMENVKYESVKRDNFRRFKILFKDVSDVNSSCVQKLSLFYDDYDGKSHSINGSLMAINYFH